MQLVGSNSTQLGTARRWVCRSACGSYHDGFYGSKIDIFANSFGSQDPQYLAKAFGPTARDARAELSLQCQSLSNDQKPLPAEVIDIGSNVVEPLEGTRFGVPALVRNVCVIAEPDTPSPGGWVCHAACGKSDSFKNRLFETSTGILTVLSTGNTRADAWQSLLDTCKANSNGNAPTAFNVTYISNFEEPIDSGIFGREGDEFSLCVKN